MKLYPAFICKTSQNLLPSWMAKQGQTCPALRTWIIISCFSVIHNNVRFLVWHGHSSKWVPKIGHESWFQLNYFHQSLKGFWLLLMVLGTVTNVSWPRLHIDQWSIGMCILVKDPEIGQLIRWPISLWLKKNWSPYGTPLLIYALSLNEHSTLAGRGKFILEL